MKRPRVTILSILTALLALSFPAASVAGGTPVVDVDQPAGSAADYWTPARMRAAEPVPTQNLPGEPGEPGDTPGSEADQEAASYVPPASPGSDAEAEILQGTASGTAAKRTISEVTDPALAGIRAHGKVFFTIPKGSDAGDFVCSGTAINSRNRSVVLTAGHCVFDSQTGGGKATNWIFVPAYEAGLAPFGDFEAKKLSTTKQWKRYSNLRFDLGAAIVRRNTDGQQLQTAVGARGIGFSQPRKQSFEIFGYPAEIPFDGENEFLCTSKTKGSDSPGGAGPAAIAAKCDMTGGASGGGWVVGNTVLSVISYGYNSEPGVLYGPYLSSTAKQLYKSVRGK